MSPCPCPARPPGRPHRGPPCADGWRRRAPRPGSPATRRPGRCRAAVHAPRCAESTAGRHCHRLRDKARCRPHAAPGRARDRRAPSAACRDAAASPRRPNPAHRPPSLCPIRYFATAGEKRRQRDTPTRPKPLESPVSATKKNTMKQGGGGGGGPDRQPSPVFPVAPHGCCQTKRTSFRLARACRPSGCATRRGWPFGSP